MGRKYFMKYSLELVKEDECCYNGKVISSVDAYKKVLEVFKLNKKAEEHLVMFCLDIKCNIIGAFLISKGGINYLYTNMADIIKRALLCNSKRILIAHNHPSGSIEPSKEDIKITKRIEDVCKLIDIELVDHLIIGYNNYKSLKSYSNIE